MKGVKPMSAVPKRYRLSHPQRFRRPGLRRPAEAPGPDRRDPVRPPERHAGREDRHQCSGDITTNLPYVAGAHLAFDHHLSETIRNSGARENHVIDPRAPSAARVVYDYYGGTRAFPSAWRDMMDAVDKGDAARFSREEVLDPQRLEPAELPDGRAHRPGPLPRVPHLELPADDGPHRRLPQPHDRPDHGAARRAGARPLYFEHDALCKDQIRRCARVFGNLVVLDLREEDVIYAGNRFIIYALFPETNISIHVLWGLKHQNTVFATGKSILNRSSNTNIGMLMLEYGGGGHENAGTCQVSNDMAEDVLGALVKRITSEG
jgi:hypothetical protein